MKLSFLSTVSSSFDQTEKVVFSKNCDKMEFHWICTIIFICIDLKVSLFDVFFNCLPIEKWKDFYIKLQT